MQQCRKCGKQTDPIWFGKCRACHHLETHASSLSGILLILTTGLFISIGSVLAFFATMPPWYGPGNDFAPIIYIMSIGGFFVGPVMSIGGYIGARRAQAEFNSRLDGIGIAQDGIHSLDRQALKIGASYMLILIGGFSVASSLLMIVIIIMVSEYTSILLFGFTCLLMIGLGPVALGLFIQEWSWKTANSITKLYP